MLFVMPRGSFITSCGEPLKMFEQKCEYIRFLERLPSLQNGDMLKKMETRYKRDWFKGQ